MLISGGGSPFWAILIAFDAGCAAGCVTALLNTKLRIQPLISSILVMLALYSVNLRVMGGRANIHLMNTPSIYHLFAETALAGFSKLVVAAISMLIILLILYFFLNTRLGFALRATGDNEVMVRAAGIDSNQMKILGLALANGLVAASGAMIAQYQSYADAGMGVGMVVIGLASVIIGEASLVLNRYGAGCWLSSLLHPLPFNYCFCPGRNAGYRFKLVSAVIVAVALSAGF